MPEHDPLLDAILATGVKLPTPSATLLRLQALAADENAGPGELAQLIGQDPALTGEFIRVANSPVFRTRNAARSVKAAITILGRTRTLAVITSNALRGQLAGVAPRAVEAVWSGAARAADAAYRVAQACGLRAQADLAYLAALMHDVGVPVLLHRFPEQAAIVEAAAGGLDAAALALDGATGANHAAVGAMVARNWKLPAEVVEAIALHHLPAAMAHAAAPAALLAIVIAAARRLRDGPGPEWDAWAPLAEARLGLDQARLEALASAPADEA